MRKGQSLIMQFILFFLIGLSLFGFIGTVFKMHSDSFRSNVADSTRKLIGSYISSAIIALQTCQECDYANATVKIENMTANYVYELQLNNYGLRVFSHPGEGIYNTPIHNLNDTLSMTPGAGFSTNPIILILSKIENKLELTR